MKNFNYYKHEDEKTITEHYIKNDEKGRVVVHKTIEIDFDFDDNENITDNDLNDMIITELYKYDEKGNEIEYTVIVDSLIKTQILRYYNEKNKIIRSTYFDRDENEDEITASFDYFYDEDDNFLYTKNHKDEISYYSEIYDNDFEVEY